MFLPGNQSAQEQEEAARRAAFSRIEAWSLELTPPSLHSGLQVSVQEVQCNDPQCSPVDTAIAIVYDNGCNGIFGIPLEAKEVTKDILKQSFPTDDVLAKWHKGEDAEWPPVQMPTEMPPLRFSVGTKVLCRVGPNPETGWAPGVIDKLWYRETNWPPASFAPYKIILDDGRNIFAPADRDEVIKKQQ